MASLQQPVLETPEDNALQAAQLKRENTLLKTAVAAVLMAGGFVSVCSSGSTPWAQMPQGKDLNALGSAASFLSAEPPDVAGKGDDDVKIPEFFDTRMEWLGCGTYVVDQGQCGDCWAASATNVFGDRICIHLLADKGPLPLPHAGAHGAGILERMFQQAGQCIGKGTMGMAHEHGCERKSFFVSPQPLVSCASVNNTALPTYHPYAADSGYMPGHTLYPSSSGCNGGEAQDAWRYLYHEGLSTMDSTQKGGCTPYTSNACSKADPENNGCHVCDFTQCADTGVEPNVFTVHSFGWIMEDDLPDRGSWNEQESFDKSGTDRYRPPQQKAALERQVRKMQIEMMTNGPLHTCIDDYANFALFFNAYPQAIYNSTEGSPKTGGHCIELMGWGTDHATGMPYWTWKNSWGANFANGGYARFIRGRDLLGIESDVWTGCPTGSNCKLTAGVVRNESWVPKHAWFPYAPGWRPANTTQRQPSRSWSGGKEVELTREMFSHPTVAPLVTAAVRKSLGNPELSDEAALAAAGRVWSRSVRGLRVRVEVAGVAEHMTAHRHMEGHVTTE